LEYLEEILEQFFGMRDIQKEEMIVLKTIFDALDRPEFLSNVPKVSKQAVL